MIKNRHSRRDAFSYLGTVGLSCCAAAGTFNPGMLLANDNPQERTNATDKPRCEKRAEFSDKWLKRFMDVLDSSLDTGTRNKIMQANGKICYRQYISENNAQVQKLDFDKWAEWARTNVKSPDFRVEGNTIYFQYMSSAETGKPSAEGQCLCMMAESAPKGLSPTYCMCSVGYVREMHEMLFGRECEVELLESVLQGSKRCKFKITVK